jgi:hypothetical protein
VYTEWGNVSLNTDGIESSEDETLAQLDRTTPKGNKRTRGEAPSKDRNLSDDAADDPEDNESSDYGPSKAKHTSRATALSTAVPLATAASSRSPRSILRAPASLRLLAA